MISTAFGVGLRRLAGPLPRPGRRLQAFPAAVPKHSGDK
jgi:hypothetical protein